MRPSTSIRAAALPAVAACVAAAAVAPLAPPAAAASGARAAVPGNERIFSWIKGLTGPGYRRSGTPASAHAARYVRDRFRAFGLKGVRFEEARTFSWRASRWGLSVAGQRIDSYPVAHSLDGPRPSGPFSTGPAGLRAEIADVGDGTDADFERVDVRGRIVLFNMRFLRLPFSLFQAASEFYWDPRHTLQPTDSLDNPYLTNFPEVPVEAMRRGAVGFVGVLQDYFDSNRYHNEYYRRERITPPGLWITRRDGERVRSLLAAGPGPAQATLVLDGRRAPATARSVIGFLPGRTRQTVLVESHHDSVWKGAVEDASGTAEVLALARHFSRRPRSSRRKTLMFTTFDSHFTGYQGHQQFVRRYVDRRPGGRRMVAAVALEHIARHARIEADGSLRVTRLAEPRGVLHNTSARVRSAIARAIIRNDLERTALLPANVFSAFGGNACDATGMPTDVSFVYGAGVPVVSLISGPIYLYDRADTLDKVAREDLQPVARAFSDVVRALDRTPAGDIPGKRC